VILYAGGISPNKNLQTLIRAFAGSRSRERARLVLVGDYQSDGFKSCYTELTGLVQELQLSHRVTFTGYIPDAELCDLYNRASVFAMPSFDEGFGLPAMEAMSCGLPVIVSTGNAMEEIVGSAGLCVPPLDVAGWSAQIDRVLENRAFAGDLSSRALARAAEFSWDRAAGELLSVFEDAARERRA
jgi:glycosyltransferase involved in cell wall biosynthesis